MRLPITVTIPEVRDLPAADADWRTAMRERAHSIRRALSQHRWAIGLMETRTSPGPATLRHHDAVLGCLRHAGFSVPLAAHAFSALDSYIYGFVMQEVAWPGDNEETFEPAADFAERTSVEAYPHLVEIAQIVAGGDWDIGRDFERGLDLLLDALERERAGAGGP